MSTTEILMGLATILFAGLAYFAGIKKASNEDVAERARFEGTMSAKIDELIKRFDRFEEKISKNIKDLDNEIDEKIKEHEMRYHNNGN